jgi:hypothetical protein
MKLQMTIAAVLALTASSPGTAQQERSTEWRTKKVERYNYAQNDAQRQFADYSRCVVNRRYAKARAVVLAPYASPEQSNQAMTVVRDEDGCLQGGFSELRMSFRPEVLVGGLAQSLVLKDYPDLPTVIGSYQPTPEDEKAKVAQMNAAERFGRCLVYLDSASVLALLSSRPATAEEGGAIDALREDMSRCVGAGSTLHINQMFVRNTTGVAAYRLAQQISPRGPSTAKRR